MDHGLLRVQLPRATTQRSRRITIGRGRADRPATIESTATEQTGPADPT